jgi:hypothetical protein
MTGTTTIYPNPLTLTRVDHHQLLLKTLPGAALRTLPETARNI